MLDSQIWSNDHLHHLSTAAPTLKSQLRSLYHKPSSEQWPPVNNGHKFWVPKVVVVHKFDSNFPLNMFHIIKKRNHVNCQMNACAGNVAAAFMENKSSRSKSSIWKDWHDLNCNFFSLKFKICTKNVKEREKERKKGFVPSLARLQMNSIQWKYFNCVFLQKQTWSQSYKTFLLLS